jgi:hypothetical protein
MTDGGGPRSEIAAPRAAFGSARSTGSTILRNGFRAYRTTIQNGQDLRPTRPYKPPALAVG